MSVRIAHISDNKVTNISLWEQPPADIEDSMLVDESVNVGDELADGKFISVHSLKSVDAIKEHLLGIHLGPVLETVAGFTIKELPMLLMALAVVDPKDSVLLTDAAGIIQSLTGEQIKNLVTELHQARQNTLQNKLAIKSKIDSANTGKALLKAFPENLSPQLIHPTVK